MESESICMLRLKRILFLPDSTIGALYVNGVYFCDTLEDKYRNLYFEQKVAGSSAIPFGTYKGIMSMSQRFKRVLPLLLNVPFFTGIRIHGGNTHEHTRGCLLVGKRAPNNQLIESQKTLEKLLSILSHYQSFVIEVV